jgi:hypothetical protein
MLKFTNSAEGALSKIEQFNRKNALIFTAFVTVQSWSVFLFSPGDNA